jgi:hypothetical protein
MRTTEQHREYRANYLAKAENRLKYAARQACICAIRTGELVRQSCELCGSTEKTDAHHDDYSRPLDVRWFCRPCHIAFHKGGSATHCKRGHEMTGHNIRFSIENGKERRRCRQCHTDATRNRKFA